MAMNKWQTVCTVDAITPNTGRCALLGNHQVAVFRVQNSDKDDYYAIDNYDPFSEANVISRGIIGSVQDRVVVASPIYKQHFCLSTGECLEENVQLRTWPVRLQGNDIQLAT
jgi:nitrite reductase (NADH) small subunit